MREGTTDFQVTKGVWGTEKRKSYGCGANKGEKWLDIGANIGAFSFEVLQKGGRVVAYEPSVENYAILQQNICKNFSGEDYVLHNKGLTAAGGKKQLYSRDKKKFAMFNISASLDGING
jgi:hypothetical protein